MVGVVTEQEITAQTSSRAHWIRDASIKDLCLRALPVIDGVRNGSLTAMGIDGSNYLEYTLPLLFVRGAYKGGSLGEDEIEAAGFAAMAAVRDTVIGSLGYTAGFAAGYIGTYMQQQG